MTGNGRYYQGFGLSLLIHGLLLAAALLLWQRPPDQRRADPLQWDISLLSKPPAPPVIEAPPLEPEPASEPTADVVMEPLPAVAPEMGGGTPSFGTPKLAVPLGDGPGAIAVPFGMAGGSGPGLWAPGEGGTGAARSLPDFDSKPLPTLRPNPEYPIEARRKKLEGWVRVELLVLEDGSVTEVKARQAQPAGVFEAAALAAVARWKFRPATEAGKPVRRRATVTVRFDL